MKGMANMMKQAQKLQNKMMKLQDELSNRSVEGSAGGGMVRVKATGKHQIESIEIEQDVIKELVEKIIVNSEPIEPEEVQIDSDQIELLQDLIVAAVNDALNRSQEMVTEEMSKLTGGLNIPGLM